MTGSQSGVNQLSCLNGWYPSWEPSKGSQFDFSRYKYYGNSANIAEELPYIVSTLTNGTLKLPLFKPKEQVGNSDNTKTILTGIKNQTLLRKLSELYKTDYHMFGFQYPDPWIEEI